MARQLSEKQLAHLRNIASKGGQATVAKHGARHMSEIGKRGFDALAQRLGDYGAAVSYLQKNQGMALVARADWGAFKARETTIPNPAWKGVMR